MKKYIYVQKLGGTAKKVTGEGKATREEVYLCSKTWSYGNIR